MFIIGLTGGIASGKSTVAGMLSAKGALVICADQISREVVEPGRPAWRELVEWLGREILQEDGTIDRARLGQIVFHDPAARRKLNAIVHPRVGEEIAARTERLRRENPGAVLVYDIPLLIEAGMQDLTDLVLLVYVTPEVQLKRLQERDGLSREEALARIRSQMPLKKKRQYARVIIDNSGTLEETARQVDRFWENLQVELQGRQ